MEDTSKIVFSFQAPLPLPPPLLLPRFTPFLQTLSTPIPNPNNPILPTLQPLITFSLYLYLSRSLSSSKPCSHHALSCGLALVQFPPFLFSPSLPRSYFPPHPARSAGISACC